MHHNLLKVRLFGFSNVCAYSATGRCQVPKTDGPNDSMDMVQIAYLLLLAKLTKLSLWWFKRLLPKSIWLTEGDRPLMKKKKLTLVLHFNGILCQPTLKVVGVREKDAEDWLRWRWMVHSGSNQQAIKKSVTAHTVSPKWTSIWPTTACFMHFIPC